MSNQGIMNEGQPNAQEAVKVVDVKTEETGEVPELESTAQGDFSDQVSCIVVYFCAIDERSPTNVFFNHLKRERGRNTTRFPWKSTQTKTTKRRRSSFVTSPVPTCEHFT